MRRILLRTALFVAPGAALWALLPLLARQVLDLEAGAYGALFGALGVGAIVAALVMGRVRNYLSTNRLLAITGLLFAAVLVLVVVVPNFVVSLALLVFAGLAWTAVVSTLNAELQIFLPVWVRGRGAGDLSRHVRRHPGAGLVGLGPGDRTGRRRTTFLIAAGLMVAGVVAGLASSPFPSRATWTANPPRTGRSPGSRSIRSRTTVR